MTIFLRYTTASILTQNLTADLAKLKDPLCIKWHKKNDLHPFEDASSFEFFANKNDASLFVFASHSKKRPHALTFMRMFDHRLLDMIELMINPETLRTLGQFKNARKAGTGLKPMVCFAGTQFESPTSNAYTLARSILLDFFKGEDVGQIDVEGLQYVICISAAEEVAGQPQPEIRIRCYLVKTKRSGGRLPRVELEEMGPRVDFRVGRVKMADENLWKEAMKKPKTTLPKTKKNTETDLIGDKVGRIHMGRQNLDKLQTRKMKGLKRSRDLDLEVVEEGMEGMDVDGDDNVEKKRRVS